MRSLAAHHGSHVQEGIENGGGRAGRDGFLILSPVTLTLTLEKGDIGTTKATILGEGCETGGVRFESL